MGPVCIDTYTFLRDVLDALGPSFRCHLEMCDGLIPVMYLEKEEVFAGSERLGCSEVLVVRR